MRSMKYLTSQIVCLSILISLVSAANSPNTSLWGKKLEFKGPPCLWQLHPKVRVPALRELSVCILLRRTLSTQWTGFLYRSTNPNRRELGLGGSSHQLKVWLFGKQYLIGQELKDKEWYSICLTWSAEHRRLRVYLNATILKEEHLSPPSSNQQLAEKGTLTLGVSHIVQPDGEVQPESGNNLLGEIGLFRMWGKELNPEKLRSLGCSEGDLLRWDLQQWKYDCPPVLDDSLYCDWSDYKINMWTSITDLTNPENCSLPLEGITRVWLQRIFPSNISVKDLFVSSQRPTCDVHQQQDLAEMSNSSCKKCFLCEVYVSVDPASNVETVQTAIPALLKMVHSFNFLIIEAVHESITVLPAEIFLHVTGPPATPTALLSTSDRVLTSSSAPSRPAEVSTTGEPLDLTVIAVMPDQFFRVNLILIIGGSLLSPEVIIEKWLKQQLEANDTMMVVNLVIQENVVGSMEKYSGLRISNSKQTQFSCAFHVQEFHKNPAAEVENFIHHALTSKFENASLAIHAETISIKHIEPKNCLEEDISSVYGRYIWPETFPQVLAEMGCRKPASNRAYRLCKLDINTDTTRWANPDMTNCNKIKISDISNITVTPDNAGEVVDIIQELVDAQLSNNSQLSSSELGSVVEKLSEVVEVSIIEPEVGSEIVNIVASILLSETDVSQVAENLLDMTEQIGNSMEFEGESTNIKAPALAFSMINVDPDEFSGLTFCVSLTSSLNPEIFLNQSFVSQPPAEQHAAISLPSELNHFFPHGVRNRTRVQFHFYGKTKLFQDLYLNNNPGSNLTLNSYVVSASVNNSQVINLKERVVVTLRHQIPKTPKDKVQCMFWDFHKYGGLGGWNHSGCETRSISPHQTSCLCDHLTHFGVFLDVTREPLSDVHERILTVISYLGCGVSSIFLGITLLTYIIFEKLRQDYPSKILIHLSVALLCLSILFLLGSWLSSFSNYGLCITTAALLHYFLLASCTWMGLGAFHMYFALVKVFNTYVPSYILKFCAVGWGIPLLIVSLVLAIDKDAYGDSVPQLAGVALQSTEEFCWVQNTVVYYVTVVGFILFVFLGNLSVFIVVLIQIKQMRINKPTANSRSTLQDFKAIAGLTVLLGLTWSMGFFAIGPARVPMMYLFAICNSFQGFFIFLFQCLLKESVRKQWRIYLCCGRFRVNENSGWSRSATGDGRTNKQNLANSDSLPSDNTSSTKSLTPPYNSQQVHTARWQE